ncbi:MAG: lipopolysaccharide kinase InaA family protein [Planctomycetota bacterium]
MRLTGWRRLRIAPHTRVCLAPGLDADDWCRWLRALQDRPPAEHGGTILQDGRNLVSRHRIAQRPVVCKDFGLRHVQPAIYALRSSKAVRAARAAGLLLRSGIPTPAALAVLEHRRLGLLQRAVLITDHVPDCHTLRECLDEQRHDPRILLQALGDLIRRLHKRDCWHADLTAANVLVHDADPRRLWLIDINRLRRGRLGGEAHWRNLSQLSLPDGLWTHFLEGYVPETGAADRTRAIERLCRWHHRFRERGLRKRQRRHARRARQEATP